jgi:hypothetical protein
MTTDDRTRVQEINKTIELLPGDNEENENIFLDSVITEGDIGEEDERNEDTFGNLGEIGITFVQKLLADLKNRIQDFFFRLLFPFLFFFEYFSNKWDYCSSKQC